jgi:YbbR domain-containing protein
VRRVTDFLFRNWPLKLAAILLATVLYSGLVLGQNVRTWTGTLPVDTLRPPAGATLLADPDPVTQVRYRAPLDVGVVSPASFRATADLSNVTVEPGGEPQAVQVSVIALDPRIDIVDFQPRQVQVTLDPVTTRELPVEVTLAPVPEGLNLGPEQVNPSTVTVRGPSSRVDAVANVLARVAIDASALNVDREIELVAVDADGNQVPNVEIDPERARVRIAVARDLANRTLPVVPNIVGQPAAGYRIMSVTVEPLVATVSGESATVSQLETADTEPIDISGRNRDLEASVRIALPAGVSVAGSDTVRVIVTIGEDTGTRTFMVGVVLDGQYPGYAYAPGAEQVSVTLGGAVGALDAVDASEIIAIADMSPFASGQGEPSVALRVDPPEGLDVVAISPAEIDVMIAVEPLTPTPPPQ